MDIEHELLQTPARVFWITGLSGAGKTTFATKAHAILQKHKSPACILDGDVVRHGLCKDLNFTAESRTENIRRVAEVAKLLCESHITVLVALISPRRADRAMARTIIGNNSFVEVFIDTPLEVCIQRDPKALYAKAMRGEIANFTGISDVYERPENPEMCIHGF